MKKSSIWNVRIMGKEAIFEDGAYNFQAKGVKTKVLRATKTRIKRRLKSGDPRKGVVSKPTKPKRPSGKETKNA